MTVEHRERTRGQASDAGGNACVIPVVSGLPRVA
jgi:hypothetical protein